MIDVRLEHTPVLESMKSHISKIKMAADELGKLYRAGYDDLCSHLRAVPADELCDVSVAHRDIFEQVRNAESSLAQSVMWMTKALTHPCDKERGI